MSKTDHLPKVKKVAVKRLPMVKPNITHCMFVDINCKPVTGQPTAGIEGLTRVVTLAGLKKLYPVEIAVLMVTENTDVLDNVTGRVSNASQFDLLLGYLDKDAREKAAAAEVA